MHEPHGSNTGGLSQSGHIKSAPLLEVLVFGLRLHLQNGDRRGPTILDRIRPDAMQPVIIESTRPDPTQTKAHKRRGAQFRRNQNADKFLPRDAMLARY